MDREQAIRIWGAGREAVILALLEQAVKLQEQATLLQTRDDRIAELKDRNKVLLAKGSDSPSTPSGMKPPHEKPSSTKRRPKKPGREKGHSGSWRPPIRDEDVDHPCDQTLASCPYCRGSISELSETRDRFIEDIPHITPEITKYTIHRYWCPQCNKIVEPKVPDALPNATIGNRTLVLTAWFHYGMGVTISHIVNILAASFHFTLSGGGLVQMWRRLADILYVWYIEIMDQAWYSAYLHADETGWRVDGTTHWLWCFTNSRLTCYLIDRSRGSPVLSRFFGDLFPGILISDFWGAYNKLSVAARQVCFVHLFRELEKVAKSNQSEQWKAFRKKLTRFLRDALRLDKNDAIEAETKQRRIERLHKRLDELIAQSYDDPDCVRLVKRLKKHRDDILTFLENDIPADNNHGEREIRPAVIMRKNSYGNKSLQGAEVQSVLMSVYRTLKLRGHDPLETISAALRDYLLNDALPPLPD